MKLTPPHLARPTSIEGLAALIEPLSTFHRTAANQVNGLAEGRLAQRYNAMTAAPTTGSWARGDIVYNSAPAQGEWIGWVCVTAGTPGSWRGWGAIGIA